MTCGLAVKRPYDFENFLSSENGGVEIKRPRSTANPQCSPFRPQLGTLAQSLMHTNPQTSTSKETSEFQNVSSKCNLSGNQIESYLRAEIQYLKRRKLIPRKACSSSTSGLNSQKLDINQTASGSSNSYRHGAISPSSCHSGSDSDGEAGNSKMDVPAFMESLYEKPQFSLKQVKLICERLLKEQENRLRFEFEGLLNKKLDEKHEQYIQFAKEQLETNTKVDADYFYLS